MSKYWPTMNSWASPPTSSQARYWSFSSSNHALANNSRQRRRLQREISGWLPRRSPPHPEGLQWKWRKQVWQACPWQHWYQRRECPQGLAQWSCHQRIVPIVEWQWLEISPRRPSRIDCCEDVKAKAEVDSGWFLMLSWFPVPSDVFDYFLLSFRGRLGIFDTFMGCRLY